MDENIHVGDVVAVDTKDGHTAGILIGMSHSGTTASIMIPTASFRELAVDASIIGELSILGSEIGSRCTEYTIKRYEQVSKVFGEVVRVLREYKEENQNDNQ